MKVLVSSCMRCPTCLSLAEKKRSGLLPFLSKIIFFTLTWERGDTRDRTSKN